ncbi:T9SS type A sorting domain-containing protein [candidate division TA06 bacterium]|uniref:T9SS type A sorting domain-containing protein n=1 Tax=candidate division TA06 bacterium TaxID=2250710 RepID=A0A523URY7_UNCT6|nr:MAG: T9SS type A sorting domain-containing protein [candidate division TA06 bacterium]
MKSFRPSLLFLILAFALGSGVANAQTDFLIWDADGNTNSGPAIRSALFGAGYEGDYTTDINPYLGNLTDYCAVFICLGIYDQTYILAPGAIVNALTAYLDNNGKVYLEGGDTWAYDIPTALQAYFNIIGAKDGYDDLGTLIGMAATFTEGMTFNYSPTADNRYIDRLLPDTGAGAYTIFENQTPSYGSGIAYDDGGGFYKTVGVSFEFGGLEDGSSPSTKVDLADSIMSFFGCVPTIHTLNVAVTSINSPGSWIAPNTPVTPQATVKNLGSDTANFDVTCVIDSLGDTLYTDIQSVANLDSGSTQLINFASWTPDGIGNCYGVTVYTDLSGDQTPANDTLVTTSCVFDTTSVIVSQYTFDPPTANGFMAPGEWIDATRRDVSNIFNSISPGAVYFYVKNDNDNLYIAIDAVADVSEERYDVLWTFMDDNDDGAWPRWPVPTEGEFAISNIGANDSVSLNALNSDSCNWWPVCDVARGQYANITSGNMQYEFTLSLAVVPDTFCWGYAGIQASACDTMGLWLAVLNQSPVPTWIGWWPTSAEDPAGWACAPGKMGKVILGCPASIYDAGVVSLDAPSCFWTDSLHDVQATVRNVGNMTIDSIFAVCTIDSIGGNAYTGNAIVSNLAPGQNSLMNFIPWVGPSVSPDSFTMTVTITATQDTLTGNNALSKTIYECTVGIEEKLTGPHLPRTFGLSQNRPNPFSRSTTIAYALPRRSSVSIKVFDVAGNEVRTLVNNLIEPGFHSISWDGKDARGGAIATGVYFLRMDAGTFNSVRKIVMLK